MRPINNSFSIVIPAYQEAESVGLVISGIHYALKDAGCDYEVILVCDGSTDGTGDIAESLDVNVIRHPYNKGYGAALKSGIRAAKNETLVLMDADGQHDGRDILRLLAHRSSYDMVVGARKGTAGSPIWRRPGKIFLGWLANCLTGKRIPDLNSGFRALDREMALRFLPLMPNGFSFSTTSTIAAFKGGYDVCYMPIEIHQRQKNRSMVRIIDGFNTIMLIVRIITLFSPLRIFLPISFITFLVGISFVFFSYFTAGESSIKGLITLLTSIQFFLFGILVDQISAVRRGEVMK